MNAAQVIEEVTAFGIQIRLEGNDLLLKAEAKPPASVLELLSNHKADILTLLQSGSGRLDYALLRLNEPVGVSGRADVPPVISIRLEDDIAGWTPSRSEVVLAVRRPILGMSITRGTFGVNAISAKQGALGPALPIGREKDGNVQAGTDIDGVFFDGCLLGGA